MSCDLCKHEHERTDILCEPCREMMARLTQICRANPDVLSISESARQATAGKTWWATVAGANS